MKEFLKVNEGLMLEEQEEEQESAEDQLIPRNQCRPVSLMEPN